VSIDCLDPLGSPRSGRSARLAHHVERTARSGARASAASKEEGISPTPLSVGTEDRVTKNRLHFDCDRATIRRSAATPRAWCHRGRRRTVSGVHVGVLGDPKATSCVLRPFTDERWRLSRNPRRSVRLAIAREDVVNVPSRSSGSSRDEPLGGMVSMKRSRPIFIQKESAICEACASRRRISRR